MRLIPPVAVPFGVGAITSSVLDRARRRAPGFAEQLAARFGARQAVLFGSGRAALAAAFAAHRRDDRDEVLMPAYTCWSVPAAAVRSRCRVRLYDVDPATFLPADPPWHEAGGSIAAVVVADLLSAARGWESAVDAIGSRFPESLVVEDRAQSWPAGISSRGVTLLSFGRGKPLPLGHGGALLTSGASFGVSVPASQGVGLKDAVALAATVVLGRPGLFRLPASIPMLGVGRTVFDPRFDDARPFREWQDRLGAQLLAKMDDLIHRRSRHAAQLADLVGSLPGWTVGPWSDGPLRLPVFAPSRGSRDRTIDALGALGVSASTMYPGTLLDIPELRPHLVGASAECRGAREIADRLLTLPVYPTLSTSDLDRVGRALLAAAREAGR